MSLIETHSLPCQTSTNAKALASIARLAAVLLIVGAATENVTCWLFLRREKILITACDVCYWPNSAVAAWRPGRRLSGDKLPTRPGASRRDLRPRSTAHTMTHLCQVRSL